VRVCAGRKSRQSLDFIYPENTGVHRVGPLIVEGAANGRLNSLLTDDLLKFASLGEAGES